MSERNIEVWTRANRDYTDARAEQAWLQDEIDWGIWARSRSGTSVLFRTCPERTWSSSAAGQRISAPG